jgi:Tfp pilus assembly protein PilV
VRLRSLLVGVGVLGVAGLALSVPAITQAAGSVSRAPTVHQASVKAAHAARPTMSSNLYYHGGTIGVETGLDKVYLVYWGSQWNSNDPSGEATIQHNFFSGVGGSSWNRSVTQYCEGVLSGTVFCNGTGTAATNPPGVLVGTWFDNVSATGASMAAPSSPTQSQLAAEAVNAAGHFGNTGTSNNTVQYVISTATQNSSSGFGTQYCAWHSSTTDSSGNHIAYTNMPYITDAGASCGANFNGLGANAGITIVGGHEFGETETDIFPNGGWLDSRGAENGDKCAWISSGQGAAANVTFTTGTFPVQSLWSNASNSSRGGCVLSY